MLLPWVLRVRARDRLRLSLLLRRRRAKQRAQRVRQLALAAGTTLLLCAGAAFAEPSPLRGGADNVELARMQALHPELVSVFERGERLLAQGDRVGALAAFEQVAGVLPESALATRRRCQTLVELNRRQDAIEMCKRAVARGRHGPALAMRAAVAALMLDAPTPDELALALLYAQKATSSALDQPWGYAAMCDIAYRLKDPNLLAQCQKDLLRVGPDHYETRRALGMQLARLPLAACLFWGLFAGVSVFTLGHALLRAWHARSAVRPIARLAAVCLIASAGLASGEARAADPSFAGGGLSRFKVNQDDPVSSVPSPAERDQNPLEYGYHLMDLAALGGAAAKREDYRAAAKFYEATVKADPESAIGYRMACDYNEKSGQTERARSFCRGALGAQGVRVNDYLRYVELVLTSTPELGPKEREELENIAQHLAGEPSGKAAAAQVECELAVRSEDSKRLQTCTRALAQAAPNAPKTIGFRFALALRQGDVGGAEQLLALAKKNSLSPQALGAMELSLRAESSPLRRAQRNWSFLLAGVLVLGVIGLSVMSKRTRVPVAPRVT